MTNLYPPVSPARHAAAMLAAGVAMVSVMSAVLLVFDAAERTASAELQARRDCRVAAPPGASCALRMAAAAGAASAPLLR